MTHYDYLIVGSGLYGATFAYKAKLASKKVLVIDKRSHLGGNIYCEEGLTQQGLSRYLLFFDELTVFARRAPTTREYVSHARLTPISDPRIRFVFADSISGVFLRIASHSKVRATLGDLIADADAVIGRLPSEFGLMASALARACSSRRLLRKRSLAVPLPVSAH